ncbi:unnamed protein product [Adineta steineri]|uniref:Uncharacterized protein n=1 Tax=Adineta steineri TaxID=433720 RepID=A0A815MY59_9BILA|nr:unnamed protein product [Adineta steineri]
MQEKQQQIKLPSAWKPDEWVCHHSSSRQSTRLDDYFHRQSKMKSPMTTRNIDTPLSPKRISTARLRRQIENLSLKSTEYRMSSRKSKVKRLTDTTTPISYRSFLTYASRHGLTPPIHIPKMSKQSLKRWLDARDAYLGHNYPYIMERFKRRHRQRIKSTKSANETYRTIDYDEAISIRGIPAQTILPGYCGNYELGMARSMIDDPAFNYQDSTWIDVITPLPSATAASINVFTSMSLLLIMKITCFMISFRY